MRLARPPGSLSPRPRPGGTRGRCRSAPAAGPHNRIIDYDPTLALAWNNLASERRMAGDWRGSWLAVTRAVALDPCYLTALRNETVWFDDAGQYELERRAIDQMLRCDPLDVGAWQSKGRLLAKTGHAAEAEQCFARAKRLQGYRFR